MLILLCAALHSFAQDGGHKARIDQLMKELDQAAKARDEASVKRISAELKKESDALNREMDVKRREAANSPQAQDFKRRAQGAVQNLQTITDTLEYRIMKAASDGKLDEVKSLRRQGADVNTVKGMVQPPLMRAASRGDVAMATFLIAEGARINLEDGTNNALMYATDVFPNKDNSEMIRFLVSKGADINYRWDTMGSAAQEHKDPRVAAYMREQREKTKGKTALMAAVRKNHVKHVRTLISLHADTNLYSMGSTPLMAAKSSRNREIISLLEGAGAK